MKGFYVSVSLGLLEQKHYRSMKESVWLFLWLLDKMTSISEDGVGKVLGGKPIKHEDIQKDLDIPVSTYRRYLKTLKKGGYINVVRTPYGLSISINKAQKVYSQRSANNETSKDKTDMPQMTHLKPNMEHLKTKYGTSNIRQDSKDKTVRQDTTTNVVAQTALKVDNRDSGIQEGIDLLKELYGSITKEHLNRFALKRLYANKTKERTFRAIQFAHKLRDEEYCPVITNYMDLEQKWDKLETFAQKMQKERRGYVGSGNKQAIDARNL